MSNLSGIPPYNYRGKKYLVDSYCKELNIQETYFRLFNRNDESYFTFGAGAQFIVSRENIQENSKEMYKKIIDMLSVNINPFPEGFAIERLWGIILTID